MENKIHMAANAENPGGLPEKGILESIFGKQLGELKASIENFTNDFKNNPIRALLNLLGIRTKVTKNTADDLEKVRLETISGLRGRVVAEARRHIGKKETSHNAGPEIALFTLGKVEPWCADFVSYVLKQAGVPISCGEYGWKVASTKTLMDYFMDEKRWVNINDVGDNSSLATCVKPGDVVVWRHNNASSEGTGGHTEIVEEVDPGSGVIKTIGGNTTGPENDGKANQVALKERRIADLRKDAVKGIVGFGILTNNT